MIEYREKLGCIKRSRKKRLSKKRLEQKKRSRKQKFQEIHKQNSIDLHMFLMENAQHNRIFNL